MLSRLRQAFSSVWKQAGSGRPVLTSWQYGLGRVTAMTTEPVGPGTRGWRQWGGYGQMFGRLLARTSRSAQPPYTFELRRAAERLHVEARSAVQGAAPPQLVDAAGDGVRLEEVAPGVFRGAVIAAAGDDVRLIASDAAGWRHRLCSDAGAAAVDERQVDPRAALPLAEIASYSGGAYVSPGGVVPQLELARAGTPLQATRLWPWLILLTLILYLFDVYDRRRAVGARRAD